MKNIDEQIEEVTLHNKWFELTGIEISPEIAVFLRWAFKLIQKEREEAIEEENMKMAKWCDEEGNDTVSYVEEFINAKSKKTKEEAVRRFAKEIWEMSKALYNSTVLDSDVNRDNYNALCRINKRCAEAIGDKEKYGEPTVESLAGVKK